MVVLVQAWMQEVLEYFGLVFFFWDIFSGWGLGMTLNFSGRMIEST